MDRPSWDDIYMGFAFDLSNRSTCFRSKVGSVIVTWDYNCVLSIGYNGNYRRGPNVCDSDKPGACGCIHSENNALLKMDYNSPEPKRMYVTMTPCVMCAKLIINANITEVVFCDMYRDPAGLELLKKNNVFVRRHEFS